MKNNFRKKTAISVEIRTPGRYKRDTETTMEDIASIESIRMNVKKTSRRFMHEKGQQIFFTRESERLPLNYSRQS